MPSIDEIRELLKQMTEEQRLQLIHLCNIENDKCKIDKVYLQFKNNHHCPHCGSNKINKNGTSTHKYPQFICRNCHKTYTFSQGLSLRKIVKKMDKKISYPTSFYWRHKILEVMKNFDNHDKLEGIVEADETYFEESQKGSRHMTRKARKRGFSSEKRIVGLSHNKVCVLTALDRQKHSFNKPVGYGKVNKDQVAILQHRINDNSILITDGDRSYKVLKDIRLKQLKFGKPMNKVYHLNNINNFHSHLKKFMIRFNGVATKYLDNYVNYFREFRDKIDTFNQLLQLQGCYRVADIKARRVGFEKPII